MKNRISKILGIGLALVLALALVAGFAVPVAASPGENEWQTFAYPDAGADGDWFRDASITAVGPMAEAINGDLYVYVAGPDNLFISEDGGRTWAETGYEDLTGALAIVDMVCSSIDDDIVYVTDGNYVYKSTDAGDEFAKLAPATLEELIEGACGTTIDEGCITCLDVTYDDDDDPFVFIGTDVTFDFVTPDNVDDPTGPPSVLYINEGGYPSTWTDLELHCFHPTALTPYVPYSIGCAPNWADSRETYVVVSTSDEVVNEPHTWVVYTVGSPCSWPELAELFWDCDDVTPLSFEIQAASRIAFPDDWEDAETLFVGVVDAVGECSTVTGRGGDVYSATSGLALDRNVAGIGTAGGCVGVGAVDITSLDICGDYDEASLIAGAYCDTNVYYSYDGGWSWDASAKDPTGDGTTYVLWYEDSALAATSGDECAVSRSCITDEVEDVGECWNQISLIADNIDRVQYLDHSPGYITESETMFMLTAYEVGVSDSYSVFRYDQTYWERVFWTPSNTGRWMVLVSPDFNDTNAVYVANMLFEIWRTLDAGCSWDQLTFPCAPAPTIYSGVVIDEDTGITGGSGMVYKTTRHGARPWDEYEVTGAGGILSFDLEPGYEDPGTVLLGDNDSQVFISEDGGEEWDLVGDCAAVLTGSNDTSVVFDPTSDIIYAAAGEVIARCVIDPDEDWADQEWEEIFTDSSDEYWGIVAAGDTALYVGDRAVINADDGGMLRSLNPDTDDAVDVVFERIDNAELNTGSFLSGLLLTTDVSDDGCAENVLWAIDWDLYPEEVWVYEDTLAAPVVLDMPLDEQKLTTTNSATLSWNELCGADCYEVSLYQYCPECPDEKVEVNTSDLMDCHCLHNDTVGVCECVEDDCIVVDGLKSGIEYYWQVRVCIGEPYLSKWSEERTFMTALLPVPFVDLCSPACGSQDIILTPNFAWGPVTGATGYDIELATTETFTAGVIRGSSTVNAWVLTAPLDYAETYYWRVRAEKDGVFSAWTVCMFTTMEEPVVPPPPVVVQEPPPAPQINIPPAQMITPNWIYAIIGIGAALCVVVIVLIVRTRRTPA